MTQMLLFDFPSPTLASPVPVSSQSAADHSGRREVRREVHSRVLQEARQEIRTGRRGCAEAAGTSAAARDGSLPLYDPAQGELHRIGDLAQLVLARYDIVHRRRAARLRRAQASPAFAG